MFCPRWLKDAYRLLITLLPTAVALIVAMTTACTGGELKINVSSFPPGLPFKPGTAILLSVEGLDDGQTAIWHRVATEGDVVLPIGDQFLFAGTVAGQRTFVVQVEAPGVDPMAVAGFMYGEPNENPQPPPVPTPGDYAQVIVIEEQHDRTESQAEVLDDPVWQTIILKAGATYRIEDDDLVTRDQTTGKDVTPEWLTPILKVVANAEIALPVVCFVGEDGKIQRVVALPNSVEGMRELVEQ